MPFDSSFPPLNIPDTDIWDFVFGRSEEEADQTRKGDPAPFSSRSWGHDADVFAAVLVASDDSSQFYTASRVEETTRSFADALRREFTWTKGNVVALLCENSIHVPPVIWGTLYAGGIVAPLNPGYKPEELAYHLRESAASVIVTQQALLTHVIQAAADCGIPHSRIVILPDARRCISPFSALGNIRVFTDLIQECGECVSETRLRKAQINPEDDVAFLVFSSGTTGLPKGVPLTHRNIVSNVLMFDAVASVNTFQGTKDIILAFLPFYHIYGLTVLLHHPFYRRAKIVVMDKYTLSNFCKAIDSHRVSVAYIVPSVAIQLLQSDARRRYDLTSVRYMVSGAAPLAEELVQALYTSWGLKLLHGYGLSEASPAVSMMSLDDYPKGTGTVGKLLPNQQVKLVELEDPAVEVNYGANQAGEICIRGPNVFKGYYKNAAATEAAFTADGFFRTGDVGVFDSATRYLRITERIKDLIKYKGFQVAPAELEALLMSHEDVADVCVVGVFDPDLATEVPRAYVVPAGVANMSLGSETVSAQNIRAWLDSRVAKHKSLRGGVVFVEELPRTASGKVLRRMLQEGPTPPRMLKL
ncbi:MAG: putative NRPS-like protein biosynthetic cluster [Bathelium mastoideum]|nr:MAG: putative NRPS-like protein biosynthetic cluster [Bathelium mastoideum]